MRLLLVFLVAVPMWAQTPAAQPAALDAFEARFAGSGIAMMREDAMAAEEIVMFVLALLAKWPDYLATAMDAP